MNTPIAILGIAGSLRRGSYNRAALRAAERLVPEGARLDIFDLAGYSAVASDWQVRTRPFRPQISFSRIADKLKGVPLAMLPDRVR
jgi:chromate reductase